jgi:hypothetical protein
MRFRAREADVCLRAASRQRSRWLMASEPRRRGARHRQRVTVRGRIPGLDYAKGMESYLRARRKFRWGGSELEGKVDPVGRKEKEGARRGSPLGTLFCCYCLGKVVSYATYDPWG